MRNLIQPHWKKLKYNFLRMVNKAIHLIQAARSNGVFVSVANDQLSIKYSKEKNIEPELLEEIKNNKELIIDFQTIRN